MWRPIAYRIHELPPTMCKGKLCPTLGYAWRGRGDRRGVELSPRQFPREFLDTTIHEALHVLFPLLRHSRVIFCAWAISSLLWRLGYRRKK
jgi:hypothetical protein